MAMTGGAGELGGERARYSPDRFEFGRNEDGTRKVVRPREALVKSDLRYEDLLELFPFRPSEDSSENVRARLIGNRWIVIDEDDFSLVSSTRPFDGKQVRQRNNVYFSTTFGDPKRRSPNLAAPNYAVPNYAVPNYAVPNYAVPNYAVPNYAVPNYAVPNYAVPNYAVPNSLGNRCCDDCDYEKGVGNPKVPTITARSVRLSPGSLPRLKEQPNVEIHVLDVRQQVREKRRDHFDDFKRKIKNSATTATGVPDQVKDRMRKLMEADGALLPEALYLAEDLDSEELSDRFKSEPWSAGLGANSEEVLDNFVDPATNHGIFIKGIIDRILPPDEGADGVVRLQPVMGSLGDVSDAELVKAMLHLDDEAKTADQGRPADARPVRIMSLSLAGYPEPDPEEKDVLAETIKSLIGGDREWKFVASAGNDATCKPTRPASIDGVLAVAAYGPHGPASFSNYGPWVDACAPGVEIVSDFPDIAKKTLLVSEGLRGKTAEEVFTTGYAAWSGTSFAAPFVAAMLARYMAANRASYEVAVKELIEHDDALSYPGYGTIVSYRTQRVDISTHEDWI